MAASRLRQLIAALAAAVPAVAGAMHDPAAAAADPWSWPFEPWLAALLVGSALLYGAGLRRLWSGAGTGRGIRRAEALRFALGWSALAAALMSPLDTLASRSFALHMVQHELLMVVAAPLLVLSRPLEAWTWALAPAARRSAAAVARHRAVAAPWAWLTGPIGAWWFHAAALWLWHVPALFTAALANPALHVLQHACFFTSALAFWWSVFGRATRAPDTLSLASLFTTMLHTGAIGALLTFAPTPWYLDGSAGGVAGLGALEDQQVGGLVMWVPGSLAYLVAGLAIVGAWLRPEARGAAR